MLAICKHCLGSIATPHQSPVSGSVMVDPSIVTDLERPVGPELVSFWLCLWRNILTGDLTVVIPVPGSCREQASWAVLFIALSSWADVTWSVISCFKLLLPWLPVWWAGPWSVSQSKAFFPQGALVRYLLPAKVEALAQEEAWSREDW